MTRLILLAVLAGIPPAPTDTDLWCYDSGDARAEWCTVATVAATLDHGTLAGLSDVADHTGYVTLDGARALTSSWDVGAFDITAEQLHSDIATGTAPFTVASTTTVTNLSCDYLDGASEGNFAKLAGRTGGQNFKGGAAAGEDLTLNSTANATKGHIFLGGAQISGYDEANERLGLGTITPDEHLHVYGANNNDSTIIRVENGDGVFPNGSEFAAIEFESSESPGGVNAKISIEHEGTGGQAGIAFSTGTPGSAVEAARITYQGYVGIGTTTVPHGSTGGGMLAIDGTNADEDGGPHIQTTTATDDYPLMQILSWAHDDVYISFDAYYDSGWKSSEPNSNYTIYKAADQLRFGYDSSVTAGSTVSWNVGMVMDVLGDVGIGETTPDRRLHVYDSADLDFVAQFENDGDSYNLYGIVVVAGKISQTSTTNYYFTGRNNGGGNEGGLRVVSGTFGVYDVSSRTVKEGPNGESSEQIPETTVDAVGLIKQTRLFDYRYKNPEGHTGPKGERHPIGWVAEEMTHIPGMVAPAPYGKDENGDERMIDAVSPAAMIPVNTQALKQLIARVELLEAQAQQAELCRCPNSTPLTPPSP